MGTFNDLTGEKYNKLTVISFNKKEGHKTFWNCQCDCGETTIVYSGNLKSGGVKSCGCAKKGIHVTHGMTDTKVYQVWSNMIKRCEDTNSGRYKNYGGRGILVNPSWHQFENFWEDMKDSYKEGLTIDRIDVNGNYCKENCQWITMEEQAKNKTTTRWVEISGNSYCLAEACKTFGVTQKIASKALNKGISPEEIFINKTKDKRWHDVTIHGETMSVTEMFKRFSVPKTSFRRMILKNMTPEEIVNHYYIQQI